MEYEEWRASDNYLYTCSPLPMIARFPDVEGTPYLERTRVASAAYDLLAALEAILDHEDYLLDTNWLAADVADHRCPICGAEAASEHEVNHGVDCPFTLAHAAIAKAKGQGD